MTGPRQPEGCTCGTWQNGTDALSPADIGSDDARGKNGRVSLGDGDEGLRDNLGLRISISWAGLLAHISGQESGNYWDVSV